MPTLLTRRDELFPLARQVVRESGYQYSKGHSRSQFSQTGFPSKLFGTNVNIAGTPGTPPGANGEREHPSPLAGTVGKIEGKQPRKRQRISDNDFLQQKRRVRLHFIRLGGFFLTRFRQTAVSALPKPLVLSFFLELIRFF